MLKVDKTGPKIFRSVLKKFSEPSEKGLSAIIAVASTGLSKLLFLLKSFDTIFL